MGGFLSQPKTDKVSEDGGDATTGTRFGASSMQGWRTSMEDAHVAVPKADAAGTAFYGVFDGHAGQDTAIYAAESVHKAVMATDAWASGDIKAALEGGIMEVDRALERMSKSAFTNVASIDTGEAVSTPPSGVSSAGDPNLPVTDGSGCTSVFCVIKDGTLWCANSGDSRCVLCVGGQAVAMSEDHKPHLPGELERISAAGGYVEAGRVQGRLNVSRSLGDMSFKQNDSIPLERQMVTAFPEIKTHALSSEAEFVLLACDGVWDVLSNQEAVDFVKEGLEAPDFDGQLSKLAESCLDHCLSPDPYKDHLGSDNMTLVIVLLNESAKK